MFLSHKCFKSVSFHYMNYSLGEGPAPVQSTRGERKQKVIKRTGHTKLWVGMLIFMDFMVSKS